MHAVVRHGVVHQGTTCLGCKRSGIKKICQRSIACLLLVALSSIFSIALAQAKEVNIDNQAQTRSVVDAKLSALAKRVSIDVKSFTIRGDNPISSDRSYAIVNQYLGDNRGIDEIEAAAEALENELRDLGESFYRVSFPPQELSDGNIELLITRYQVGEILVRGNRHYSHQNVLRSLPQLKPGNSPSSKAMARSLTLANQNAAKRTRLTLATGQTPGEIDATLTVVDQKPHSFSAWLNNTGTEASGEYRVGASWSHRNVFGRDHNLSLTFISSPEDFDEVQQYALAYKVPLYSVGGSFNLLAVKSEVDSGVVADVFEVAGSGDVYGLGYSQILAKHGDYRHQLTVNLSDKLFDNDIRFRQTQIATDVRSRPLTLAYQGSWTNGEGLELSGALSWVENLSGGGDNSVEAYQNTRVGAVQSWDKLIADFGLQISRGQWLYTGALQYAASGDRLITGEQFALGGANSIRGMDERELTGDEGYRLSLSAWAPAWRKTLRPVVFLDLGRVSNNDPIEGELRSESVASIGLLLNWNPTEKLTASASYGYLLDGVDSSEDINAGASADGDGKLHFNISYRF